GVILQDGVVEIEQDGRHICGDSFGQREAPSRASLFTAASSIDANFERSFFEWALGPPVMMPIDRRWAFRSREARASPMRFGLYSPPRKSRQRTPFAITRAASGISAVRTRSPFSARSAIQSSAASGDPGTTIISAWATASFGIRIGVLATTRTRML